MLVPAAVRLVFSITRCLHLPSEQGLEPTDDNFTTVMLKQHLYLQMIAPWARLHHVHTLVAWWDFQMMPQETCLVWMSCKACMSCKASQYIYKKPSCRKFSCTCTNVRIIHISVQCSQYCSSNDATLLCLMTTLKKSFHSFAVSACFEKPLTKCIDDRMM